MLICDPYFDLKYLLADAQPSQSDRPIVISMTEPRIQIVTIGQTVKFDCNARPTVEIQGVCSKHKLYCPANFFDDSKHENFTIFTKALLFCLILVYMVYT